MLYHSAMHINDVKVSIWPVVQVNRSKAFIKRRQEFLAFDRLLGYELASPAKAPALTTGRVEVVTTPRNAVVWINDAIAEKSVELEAGTHLVRAKSPNYVPWSSSIVVRPGMDLQLSVALAPEQTAPLVQPLPVAPPAQRIVAVGASQMQRQVGQPLSLHSAKRSGRDRVRAIICVSPQGNVRSSHILSNISTRSKGLLQAQISQWRYRPVRPDKETAVSACFADTLPVK